MSEGWDWRLTDSAKRQFDSLDEYGRERLTSKLDDVIDDAWREPPDYLEPLSGVPHQKLRVGPFRLGCRATETHEFSGSSPLRSAAVTLTAVMIKTSRITALV